MRDLLPAEVALRDRCEGLIRRTYARFGYQAVETPALESIGRLSAGQGGENEKLIYRVLKRGDKLTKALARVSEGEDLGALVELGLRYDLTVPLARYYAANQGQLPTPFKALQIGSVWRAERPQRGRYRQFTQVDIDVLGEPSVAAEIDLVAATTEALAALGLDDVEVRLNDRRLLSALVAGCGFDPAREGSVLIALDKLDKVGPDGVGKELRESDHPAPAVERVLSVLDQGWDGLVQVADEARSARGDTSAQDGLDALAAIQAAHGDGGKLRLDPSLVRGMGYYTGPIFEVALAGETSSIAGGGRYDDMIGAMLGRSVPACGFSIGFERVILVLTERGQVGGAAERVALLIDPRHDDGAAVLATASALRSDERVVSVLVARKNTRAQLDELATHGFTAVARYQAGAPPELRSLQPKA
jgi:histidyl-tRNA synthetase